MKRFLKQIVLLTLLVFIIVTALGQITFSDDFICHKTSGTEYEKMAWNIHTLNKKTELIKGSTVFLGSSLVQGAINDSIGQELGLKLLNFGIPHNGYDLNLYFLNRILKLQPKTVIFLQEKNNYKGLHKLSPLLNRPLDILKWGQSFNFFYVNYLFKRAKLSIEYLVFSLLNNHFTSNENYKDFGIVFDNKTFITEEKFRDGFISNLQKRDEYLNLYQNNYLTKSEITESEQIQFIKKSKRKLVQNYWVNNNLITNSKSQQNFLNTAKEILTDTNIKYAKVYVPVLSDVVEAKNYKRSYYKANGDDTVLLLDDFSFLNSPKYWSDTAHVNEKGAALYSKMLFEKFKNSEFLSRK
jgi:hypothetical protein